MRILLILEAASFLWETGMPDYFLLDDFSAAIQNNVPLFSAITNLDYCITTKNFYYGGDRYIEGTVTLDGAPVRRRVRLYDLRSGEIIGETWSNATTGLYRFDNVDEEREYQSIALDHEKQSTPIAHEVKIEPKIPEPYYINNMALNPQSMNDPEYYTGLGSIWGTVKDNQNNPLQRRLVLVESLSYIIVATTVSDPITGEYEFDGLSTDKTFSVIAEDSTPASYNDIIRARVTPEVI